MESKSLLELWQVWWAGQGVCPDLQFLGQSIRWWTRLGKLSQFMAGLTIVIDIIGPVRMRRFGLALHQWTSVNFTRDLLKESTTWSKAWLAPGVAGKSIGDLYRTPQGCLTITIVIPAALWFFVWLAGAGAGCLLIPVLGIAGLAVMIRWLGPAVVIGFHLLLAVPGLVVDYAVMRPIAWLLSHPHADPIARTIALALFLVGFHFDLLSS